MIYCLILFIRLMWGVPVLFKMEKYLSSWRKTVYTSAKFGHKKGDENGNINIGCRKTENFTIHS